ncbi:alpha/beta-hydrolase [Dacryopinax primogenitus]|uniref:Alpha/beta-hydrolase n=1 Tax=Dacryopinax primogenitus (strain DJM 731) TaxID=1858805 RepID=M5G3A7_DACPD|nr:alpha/beta-hydrolase [Dacryopinax primogenitus]EJU02700.1 alpha/beta-hydrolase [Dacryopinax primogenitus]
MAKERKNSNSKGRYDRPQGSWRTLLSVRSGMTLVWLVLFGFGIYAPCTLYRVFPGTGLLAARHIADVGYARYLGKQTASNTVAYLGIPYAAPPLGALRFRKPVPVDTTRVSSALVDVTQYPDFCVQGYAPWVAPDDRGGAGSEDCLKVNVYTPVCARRGDALPVLVYIHGGGFSNGNPRNWPFDQWVNDCPKFIAVHVYYRLTAFGFLAAPTSALDLNVGLHDQRAALRWARSHISAFGDDPDRVTIMGQSAGGASVWLQMLADHATGEQLFHGVIGQTVSRSGTRRPERKEAAFRTLAAKADCTRDSLDESVECLRAASISVMVRAADDMIKEHTTNDGGGKEPLRKSLKSRFPHMTESELDTYERLYPERDPNRAGNALGEVGLRCSTYLLGMSLDMVYAYRWYQPTPPLRLPADVWHSSDNWMMFEGTSTGSNGTTVFHQLSNEQRDFFHEMLAYFTSFVRSGNPNTYKLERSPGWPLYTDSWNRQVLQHQLNEVPEEDASGEDTTTAVWQEEVTTEEQERCAALFDMVESCEN